MRYGLQLKADFIKTSAPTSREGIEKYLGSGLIKGIGPVYAKKLVEKFDEGPSRASTSFLPGLKRCQASAGSGG